MIHTSLPNKIIIDSFIVILLGPYLTHFELHHVARQSSSFVRKDIADLAEFFVDRAGVDFAALAVVHFILVILNHFDVNSHEICLSSFCYLDSHVERDGYESVVQAKRSERVQDDLDGASLIPEHWNLQIKVGITVLNVPAPIRKTQQYARRENEENNPDDSLIGILIKPTLFISGFVLVLHELGVEACVDATAHDPLGVHQFAAFD